MKRFKKILSIVISACLFFSMTVVPVQAAATDNTPPVINTIEIINPDIVDGSEEMLKIRIDIVEDGAGVLAHTFAVENLTTGDVYRLRTSKCEECDPKRSACLTGTHNISFSVEDLPSGRYSINETMTNDDVGNNAVFAVSENDAWLTSRSFSIQYGSDVVNQPLEKLEIISQSVDANGILTLHATLGERRKHSLAYLNITFAEKGTTNRIKVRTATFLKKAGIMEINIPLKNYDFKNAEYYISAVESVHYETQSRNNYSPEDIGLNTENIFTVTGSNINPDYAAPVLNSIYINNTEAYIPGMLTADINVTEDGNGINRVQLIFIDPSNKNMPVTLVSNITSKKDNLKTGTHTVSFAVNSAYEPGIYKLYHVGINDNDDNYSTYLDVPGIGTQVTLHSAYENNFAFSLNLHSQELMSKINSLQEGETGLINIGSSANKVATAEMFRAIVGRDVTLMFDFAEEYDWIVNGLDIDPDKCKDIELQVMCGITDGREVGFSLEEEVLVASFPDNGELPGKMTFQIQAEYIYAKTGYTADNMKLYFLDGDELTLENSNITLTPGQAVRFEITHNSDFAITTTEPNLGKVINLKATSKSTSSIKVSWTENEAATGYYVYRSTSKSGTYKKIATTKKNYYTDKKLTAGKTYYYKVKPYNSESKSFNKTAVRSGYVSAKPRLKTPEITSVTSGNNKGKLRVSWKESSGTAKYYVYRSTSKNGTYKKIATTKNLYYLDKNVEPMTKYYYKVKAVHSKYTSRNSLLSSYKSGELGEYKLGVISLVKAS